MTSLVPTEAVTSRLFSTIVPPVAPTRDGRVVLDRHAEVGLHVGVDLADLRAPSSP